MRRRREDPQQKTTNTTKPLIHKNPFFPSKGFTHHVYRLPPGRTLSLPPAVPSFRPESRVLRVPGQRQAEQSIEVLHVAHAGDPLRLGQAPFSSAARQGRRKSAVEGTVRLLGQVPQKTARCLLSFWEMREVKPGRQM